MMKRLLVLLVLLFSLTFAQTSGNRGYLSAFYCHDIQGYEHASIRFYYNVYSVDFGPYNWTYMNLYGGYSVTWDNYQIYEQGFEVGVEFKFAIVYLEPRYVSGLYRPIWTPSECLFYGGINYPLN